ncbi:MAG: hypothetical protein LBO73_02950 [Holosporaceae bacterium]|jgi:hypothetical protein|nr:hypothetical protein [Holosporaceae bacterium]
MLSKQSLDILIDLVEIKLGAIMILDKDDVKEVQKLKNCKNELLSSRRALYLKKIQNGKEARSGIYSQS